MTLSEQQPPRAADDTAHSQSQRLEALKDLVRRSAYDVPSDEVAARIIGHAIGLPAVGAGRG